MISDSLHSDVFSSGLRWLVFLWSEFLGEILDAWLTQDQVVPEERDEEEIAEKENVIEAR